MTAATDVRSLATAVKADLRWLEGDAPAELAGTTWGVPWPKGSLPADQEFSLEAADGTAVAVQTWPIGYWPDGSLKWSAHAMGAATSSAETYVLAPGTAAAPPTAVSVSATGGHVDVDTGGMRCRIPTHGPTVIESLVRGGVEIARDCELVCLVQTSVADGDEGGTQRHRYVGTVDKVNVEQSGPVRAVVRIEGRHRRSDRTLLPFTVRLYFYAGSERVRMMHSFVYDGDPARDFVAGLGVRFRVPMRDEAYDRHIRLAGEGAGMLSEAVKGITGLRRDPGEAVRQAQVAGRATPAVSTWDTRVSSRLGLIPDWGDYSLRQLSADGFDIRKRTKAGFGWIGVGGGRRASGLGYVGGVSGGLAFGLRDFWQLHPTGLDIRDAAGDQAEATVWLWSPDAGPMDLRFYHDGMGQDTYPEQLEGLEITYEDYEPEWGTPVGIARTSELSFWAHEATPTTEQLADEAAAVRTPPLLVAPPAHVHAAKVFGDWSPPDRSTPAKAEIEDHLDFLFDFYTGQVEQHRWYGFWNYGDVMHTYDPDRHEWRYDVGGYAWDNSELSTDLWLWYSYLRSGRADIFRMAEAMTRHTGEVDVYHLGRFEDLGTRHGVQHYADSAKQLRISTAVYRRFYYFLTADERVGDLMHDLIDADKTFLTIDPIRKIRTEPYTPDRHALDIGLGTDWSALAAAWLTEWERGGDPVARQKLLGTCETIGKLRNGFITGSALYDLDTGKFATDRVAVSVSHLSAVFGLVEICSELLDMIDDEGFTHAWLQYCRLYNATATEQEAEVGQSFGNLNLGQAHSRLT
ncbi:MAG TPA: Tat pathway signal sequence domain protein, partial [Actinopolymorphaceae bacterium]|nr:Tat pathway signal sequence domain protein [Actinopolymorphaceae bacterium]